MRQFMLAAVLSMASNICPRMVRGAFKMTRCLKQKKNTSLIWRKQAYKSLRMSPSHIVESTGFFHNETCRNNTCLTEETFSFICASGLKLQVLTHREDAKIYMTGFYKSCIGMEFRSLSEELSSLLPDVVVDLSPFVSLGLRIWCGREDDRPFRL